AGTTRTIVGVVGDVAFRGLGAESGPEIYVPFAQSPFGGFFVAVRTSVAPMALAGSIRQALNGVDPDASPSRLEAMETLLSASVGQPRFRTALLAGFAAVALLLAAVGIYGVVSYTVARRTGEIGLRLALGAPPASVLGLVVGQGMVPVGLGVIVGLTGALVLTRVLHSLLYGITPTDPATFVLGSLTLLLVALAAAVVPARRASHTDPATVLREE
ncbi:MAG TPA: FtsX-like permease family protein, partial [Gemmatimonadales bacterium]|nr:FtsX-like permease family protein [Gemmatimonadales bacterium]